MNFSRSFYLSFILLLVFSTLLALAGIRGFLKLAPSIEQINKHNTQSLYIAESMMSALTVNKDIKSFEEALAKGKTNVTEKGEAEVINKIEKGYKSAFKNNAGYKETTVNNIIELSRINRVGMQNAALRAKKLSSAGAWVIGFLTLITWVLGLILIKTVTTNLIKPLAELIDVLESYFKGNKLRRCPKLAPNHDFQRIYDAINSLLDKQS